MAFGVLLLGALVYGFSLDRYPLFSAGDVFFAYPAVKAATGGSMTYAMSLAAPFGDTLWAYHGPVLPHLLKVLFRLFGFSIFVSRLPDFVGGWLAAALLVLFTKRRGYRYAGLVFAILWCGDRVTQELMYCRMDGLALLASVCGVLLLERAWRQQSNATALASGLLFGFAILIHPLALAFAAVACLWVLYLVGWRAALAYIGGGLLNLPILAWLWDFRIHDSVQQFLWHTRVPRGAETAAFGPLTLLHFLAWSRFWFLALVVFTCVLAVIALMQVWKFRRTLEPFWIHVAIAATFGLVAVRNFLHLTNPYYMVYFSVWPMLALAILAEKRWHHVRAVVVVMALLWCGSAAWNLFRIREAVIFHGRLSRSFLIGELHKDVPMTARIVTTPSLYSVPIEAGYTQYLPTTYHAEHQDLCPTCFVLMTEKQRQEALFLPPSNLDRRRVLYSGPAFPGTGPLGFPVVLLSPQVR